MKEFRLYSWKKTFFKLVVVLAYAVFVFSFIKIGLQPSNTGAVSGEELSIPHIGLDTVTEVVDLEGNKFAVPDRTVGAYYASENKIFLMGHKASIFTNLDRLTYDDEIVFGGRKYNVQEITVEAKEDIDMSEILAPATEKTLVLMTCYGKRLSDTDYSHRLIIVAR